MTWHPDMPDEYKNAVVTGDARVLAERMPDESIDLIFCDPIYDRIDDYRWLAETAARVLRDGGNLLAQAGHEFLPAVFTQLNGNLSYVWTVCENYPKAMQRIYTKRLMVGWKPYIWFSKG